MDSAGIVVAFWVLAAITVGSALAVFAARDLIHAIVYLIVSFLGMAGLFITLSADFIAVAQILIYAGAISVLFVFAVMLTPLASRDNSNSLYVVPGVLAGGAVAALVVFVAVDASWKELTHRRRDRPPADLALPARVRTRFGTAALRAPRRNRARPSALVRRGRRRWRPLDA